MKGRNLSKILFICMLLFGSACEKISVQEEPAQEVKGEASNKTPSDYCGIAVRYGKGDGSIFLII